MKRYVPKTYNNRRALRIIIRTGVAVLLISIVVFVSLFFGLRKYVVYSADGMIRLEIPFLMDEASTEPNDSGNVNNGKNANSNDTANSSDNVNSNDNANDTSDTNNVVNKEGASN